VCGIIKRTGVAGRRKHSRGDELKERGRMRRGRRVREVQSGGGVGYLTARQTGWGILLQDKQGGVSYCKTNRVGYLTARQTGWCGVSYCKTNRVVWGILLYRRREGML
jgi:IS5 family transposase